MRMDVPDPKLPIVQWVLRYNVIINDSGAGAATATPGRTGRLAQQVSQNA
jgi:hypothetical protein